MALHRRGKVWWVRFTAPDGTRVRKSTGTADRVAAQEFHDRFRAQLWREKALGERPRRAWAEAVKRWLQETSHKATQDKDKQHLRWLVPHLGGLYLDEINRDVIDRVTQAKLNEGVSNASVNRMLAVVRSILRKAWQEWEWTDRVPKVRMLAEPKRRIRWLTREQAERLLAELPPHLKAMARFTLATGLRQRNVKELKWSQVDLGQRLAWIHADEAKGGRSIGVPLNREAVEVIRGQLGKHLEYVFTYHGRPIDQVNTKAWRAALKRAGIGDFRWHDLRHTFASWHVQLGTPLNVLQELGGWESSEMVRRYAHLGPHHLAQYAERIAKRP